MTPDDAFRLRADLLRIAAAFNRTAQDTIEDAKAFEAYLEECCQRDAVKVNVTNDGWLAHQRERRIEDEGFVQFMNDCNFYKWGKGV